AVDRIANRLLGRRELQNGSGPKRAREIAQARESISQEQLGAAAQQQVVGAESLPAGARFRRPQQVEETDVVPDFPLPDNDLNAGRRRERPCSMSSQAGRVERDRRRLADFARDGRLERRERVQLDQAVLKLRRVPATSLNGAHWEGGRAARGGR